MSSVYQRMPVGRCWFVAVLFWVNPGPVVAGDFAAGERLYRAGETAAAVTLWQQLARQGDVDAQLALGYVYARGLGIERNPQRAAYWYRKAAEAGSPDAQYELGLMYEVGEGVPVDPAEAEAWYGRAVAQDFCPGELDASGRLGLD